jgi:hypothetical protein
VDGITVRLVNGIHGSDISARRAPGAAFQSGGIASAFVIMFENGWTLYYGGSGAATLDQGMWAQMYRPDAAVLYMGGTSEPRHFAMQVKLLMTENPNLRTVFPGHHRVVQQGTTIAEAQEAVAALGISLRVTEPVVGQAYSFP